MKSLRDLLVSVLTESGRMCGTNPSKDISYILKRCEDEGDAFLCITLGNFCDDFERSLSQGYIGTHSFLGFGRVRSGCLPKFLSGFTSLVFTMDGYLLDQPSKQAILHIRQICRMFKKVLLPCEETRVKAAFDSYVQVEAELALWNPDQVDGTLWNLFQSVSDILLSGMKVENLLPRHGTGAVADKLSMKEKYHHQYWYERLESDFPAADWAFRSTLGWLDLCESIEFRCPEQETPVRVITVPKTLKGPRIIGVESVVTQLCQQALLDPLVRELERNPLTRNTLRYTDQSVNARLALSSSQTGHLATLDLKEASDRVHKDVVYAMLRRQPALRSAIFACRSQASVLPDGTYCPLWKFASMGSALCFPIESMVFYAIILASKYKADGTVPSQKTIRSYSRDIAIYGDDIIVPTDWVPFVTNSLEQFCLKVNSAKSFWTGKFRESCGVDAYDGVQVTPVYCRRTLPTSRFDAEEIASYVSMHHALYERGFIDTSRAIYTLLSKLGVILLEGDASSAYLTSPFGKKGQSKWCPELHKPLVKAHVISDTSRKTVVDGWQGYARWQDLRNRSVQAVEASKVPSGFSSTALKRRWTSR